MASTWISSAAVAPLIEPESPRHPGPFAAAAPRHFATSDDSSRRASHDDGLDDPARFAPVAPEDFKKPLNKSPDDEGIGSVGDGRHAIRADDDGAQQQPAVLLDGGLWTPKGAKLPVLGAGGLETTDPTASWYFDADHPLGSIGESIGQSLNGPAASGAPSFAQQFAVGGGAAAEGSSLPVDFFRHLAEPVVFVGGSTATSGTAATIGVPLPPNYSSASLAYTDGAASGIVGVQPNGATGGSATRPTSAIGGYGNSSTTSNPVFFATAFSPDPTTAAVHSRPASATFGALSNSQRQQEQIVAGFGGAAAPSLPQQQQQLFTTSSAAGEPPGANNNCSTQSSGGSGTAAAVRKQLDAVEALGGVDAVITASLREIESVIAMPLTVLQQRCAHKRGQLGLPVSGNACFTEAHRAAQVFIGQLPASITVDALTAAIDTLLDLHSVPKMVNVRPPPAGTSQAAHALLTVEASHQRLVVALNRRVYFTCQAIYYAAAPKDTSAFQRHIAKAVSTYNSSTNAASNGTAKYSRACVVVEPANRKVEAAGGGVSGSGGGSSPRAMQHSMSRHGGGATGPHQHHHHPGTGNSAGSGRAPYYNHAQHHRYPHQQQQQQPSGAIPRRNSGGFSTHSGQHTPHTTGSSASAVYGGVSVLSLNAFPSPLSGHLSLGPIFVSPPQGAGSFGSSMPLHLQQQPVMMPPPTGPTTAPPSYSQSPSLMHPHQQQLPPGSPQVGAAAYVMMPALRGSPS